MFNLKITYSNTKNFKKGFTLIEILVVIAVIGILSAIVLASLNSARDKANIVSAQSTARSILPIINDCFLENTGGITAPLDSKTGGGNICSNGTNVANWPSLQSSGYYYNVPTDNDISDGIFSFNVIKASKPTVRVSLSDSPSLSITSMKVPPCGFYGDVDYDGYVTANDSQMIKDAAIQIIQFTADQAIRGDVDGSGLYNSTDALRVSRYAIGILTTFPVCPI